jgi:hypothetical protein
MKYSNREMKVGTIVSHLNEQTINLIPPFQRGTVWNIKTRRMLISNMIQARPIPAIFLYKEAAGSKFSYNILDGKQRLETLMLFVGNKRQDMSIPHIKDYFFKKPADKDRDFKVVVNGVMRGFSNLDDAAVRDFREYAISTIEIDLDDEDSGIDEVVNLFIDINQYGVKVSRFDVIKAMGKDPLFKQVFDLVAMKQQRKNTLHYQAKKNDFVFVLKRLAVVERLADANSRVDRMWERLPEIALFHHTRKHRAPVDILKGFIGGGVQTPRLSKAELAQLRGAFSFLSQLYRKNDFSASKLATDQPQFYTLVTSLLATDLLTRFTHAELSRRLLAFRTANESAKPTGAVGKLVKEYQDVSAKQTTHPSRRERRQQLLVEAINQL